MKALHSFSVQSAVAGVGAVQGHLVKFKGGEFGVVARGDALVPEHAPNLVDALQAPHREPLQVQL